MQVAPNGYVTGPPLAGGWAPGHVAPNGPLPGSFPGGSSAAYEGSTTSDQRVPVQLGMGPVTQSLPGVGGAEAFGATRSVPVDGWRRGLVAAIRVLWLVALAGYLGLVDDGIAPFTAGALTGTAVLLGGYARIRWSTARTRRPPAPDRPATIAALAAAALLLLAVPATMLGALTAARTAAVAAVTAATLAALLVRRPPR